MVPDLSLDDSISSLSGETKDSFLSFITTMLRWLPEERARASELLKHPWMADAIP